MKRWLLGILLLVAMPAGATTTVTGNIKTLGTGNVTSGAYVRFWLRGCGGNQPRVNGVAIVAPTQGGFFYFDMVANASGAISGTLYSTRDATGLLGGDIECGGSKTSEFYGMQAFQNGRGGPETPIHALNGVTLDITSVTPISTTPVVTAPTGDSTYLRLDGTNSPVTFNTAAFDSFTRGFLTSPFDKRFSFRSLNDSLNHFAALGVVAQDNAFGGSSGGYQAFQAVLEANPSTNTALGVTAGSFEAYVNNATGNFTGTGTNGPAGLLTITQVDSNVNIAGEMSGSIANVANFGASNTIARAVGFHSAIGNTNTATMTEADNFLSDAPQMGTGGVTKWVGFHALSLGGVGTTNYGFLADDAGTAAGTWAFFSGGSTPSSFGGQVDFGTTVKFTPRGETSLPTCNSGAEGTVASVNNSNTGTWGATITTTGSFHVLAYCDGTNWTVMGN